MYLKWITKGIYYNDFYLKCCIIGEECKNDITGRTHHDT